MNLLSVFGSERYHPMSMALNDDPVIIIIYISLYFIIASAMMLIGVVIMARSRLGLKTMIEQRQSLASLFGVICLLASLGAIVDIATIFSAVYRFDLAITGFLAGVSSLTAALAVNDFLTRD